jgi:hypothetical protein
MKNAHNHPRTASNLTQGPRYLDLKPIIDLPRFFSNFQFHLPQILTAAAITRIDLTSIAVSDTVLHFSI